MVVAARAVDGDAHGRGDHLRDHVIEVARAGRPFEYVAFGLHLAHKIPRTRGEESRGDEGMRAVWGEGVAGDLLADELVVGLVRVERLNDVVAVAPRIGAELVPLKAVGVRIVGDVEPVARPAFTEMGRGEEFVDQPFVGLWVGVVAEMLNPFRCRRQAV